MAKSSKDVYKGIKDAYESWLATKDANAVIADTDTTPKVNVPVNTVAPTPAKTVVPKLERAPANAPANAYTDTGTSTTGYSAWTPSPSVTPPTTQGTPTPTTQAESGFAQWLATDPTVKERMKLAETDYYKNLATYGARGEALAQGGMQGSGYADYLDGAAYAAMQREKAGIRSEGYAKWISDKETAGAEKKAAEETKTTNAANIFNDITGKGQTSLTESDKAYYKAHGYTDDEIATAEKSLADYVVAENKKTSTALSNLINGGTETDFLKAIGVDPATIPEEQVGAFMDSFVDDAAASGKIPKEEQSAYYKASQILDEDMTGWSADEVAENAANSVANAKGYLDAGKLTDADYKAIIDAAYKAIGATNISIKSNKDGEGTHLSTITIKVNVNGANRTYNIDSHGRGKITDKTYLNALNTKFGDSALAVYNGKVYYQYSPDKWVEVATKGGPTWLGGGSGTKDEGDDVLRVVAEYVSANGITASPFKEAKATIPV